MTTPKVWVTAFQLLCVCSVYGQVYDDFRTDKLEMMHSWKTLHFAFDDTYSEQEAIRWSEYTPGNSMLHDVDVIKGPPCKILVTIPRTQRGIPMTLGWITNQTAEDGNPIIAPYPDWYANQLPPDNTTCLGNIISVFHIQVDECGGLWILDTGMVGDQEICPPKLVHFGSPAVNDTSYDIYDIDEELLKPESELRSLIVDVRQSNCANPFVYIADPTGFQLIVFQLGDHLKKPMWRVHNHLFYPYREENRITIAKKSFDTMRGITGMALGPILEFGDRILYFHSLSSVVESWVYTSVIRNGRNFDNSSSALADNFHPFCYTRPSQSAAQVMDRNGVLFYGLMSEIALGCWNSRDYPTFGGDNLGIAVVDNEKLQFTSGIKIIHEWNERDILIMLTSPLHKNSKELSPEETNFRILVGSVEDIVRNTPCEVR